MADLEKRNLDALRPWFADKSVLWMPPSQPVTGSKRILAMFRVIFRMYSDIHWKVDEVYPVGGDRYIYLTESWGLIGSKTP